MSVALESAFHLLLILALGASFFWALEFRWPSKPHQLRLRKGWRTDAWYLLFTPLVTQNVGRLLVATAAAAVLWLLGLPLEARLLLEGWGPIASLPWWQQAIAALVLGDLVGYWTHRLLHGRLWAVHAVHHSSEEMDWMSTLRVHPLNDFLGRLLRAIPFLLLGFSPLVLAALLPFLAAHAFLIHANVSWTFGPLRYLLASPAFHRWHHSDHVEAHARNFSGILPVWDLLFGTFYLPKASSPERIGAPDAKVPDAFWGQVFYPLRGAGQPRVRLAHRRPDPVTSPK